VHCSERTIKEADGPLGKDRTSAVAGCTAGTWTMITDSRTQKTAGACSFMLLQGGWQTTHYDFKQQEVKDATQMRSETMLFTGSG